MRDTNHFDRLSKEAMQDEQHLANVVIDSSYPIENVEWSGWSTQTHHFGGEFDTAARLRMVSGGRLLLPTLMEYYDLLGSNILEIGPFFNPLFYRVQHQKAQTLKNQSSKTVTYWENDPHACTWLNGLDIGKVIACNITEIASPDFKKTVGFQRYDAIIISQVINYIDYPAFIAQMRSYFYLNGLLFLNNVVDYGIPAYFSPYRPQSIDHTVQVLQNNSFVIQQQHVLPAPKESAQPRCIIVAKYHLG